VYVQGKKKDASEFNEVVHIKWPWEELVTLLARSGKSIVCLSLD